jgi:hypothetical protein
MYVIPGIGVRRSAVGAIRAPFPPAEIASFERRSILTFAPAAPGLE